MLLPLDGPALQTVLAISDSVVVEAKVGTSDLSERKAVTIQALTGKVYVYFGGDAGVPSMATVQANGLILFKNAKETYEASNSQKVYLLAVSGTINVVVVERA